MRTWRRSLVGLVSVAALALAGCGGGGGSTPPVVFGGLTVQDVSVAGYPAGSQGPYGSTDGGDRVFITGAGFVSGVQVTFGTQPGTVVAVGASQIEVISPATSQSGAVDLVIANPGGVPLVLPGAFLYVHPPHVQSLEMLTGPTIGEDRCPIAGGETVQVEGDYFVSGAKIRIDGVNQPTTFVDAQTLTCVVPSVVSERSVDIEVQNPDGMSGRRIRGLVYTQEFSLDIESRPLTQARATHLYRRAAFGGSPTEIADAVANGLVPTVDRLMNYTNDAAVEAEAVTLFTVPPPAPNLAFRTVQQWWIHQLLKNPNPFQERLAWFLHDHFATSGRVFDGDYLWTIYKQIQTFRSFSLPRAATLSDGTAGLNYDWRQLCVEMGRDRAMLEWLDGRVSRKGNANENYARELWELFMLGEGNGYTEADIQNAARAFTGFQWYRVPGPEPAGDRLLDIRYVPTLHDETDKTIFGVTGKFGYDAIAPFHPDGPTVDTDTRDTAGGIVALTLSQRPVEASRFICGKLAAFFLYENPHDVVVNALARILRNNNWNLKPVIQTMLQSKAMYSARALKGKVKNPVEFVTGFLRTSGIDLGTTIPLNTVRVYLRLGAMGQVPLDPPDVSGWPSGTAWMAAQSQIERFNFLTFAVNQLNDVPTQIDPLLPPPGQRSPAQLVDHISALLDVNLGGNGRTRAINYVTTEMVGGVPQPLAFDPTNDDMLRMKTRGLLFIVGQYHDAHQD